MTILGKILIFVNLVFSVVTGILIVMVFATRTNWKVGYDKLKKNYDISEANVRTYADEVKAARTAGEAKAKQLQTDLDAVKVELARQKKLYEDADKAHKDEIARANLAQNGVAHVTAEIAQRRNEVAQLKQQLEARDQQLIEEQRQKKELRDAWVRADIQNRNSHKRNQELMETVDRVAQENDRLKGGGGPTQPGRKPPEDVKGIVLDIDRSGLITVSLGSDHGVTKGTTLEVYRLSPEPKYLGTLRINNAEHHEAVGRMVSPGRTPQIQKGDTVASAIISRQ